MKFRFSNGCSLSLWDSEFKELRISETSISYLTPNNSWVTVSVPNSWLTQSSKDSQSDTETSSSSPPQSKEASSSSHPPSRETSSSNLQPKEALKGAGEKKLQHSSRQPSSLSDPSPQLDVEKYYQGLRNSIEDLKAKIYENEDYYVRMCDEIEENFDNKVSDLQTRLSRLEYEFLKPLSTQSILKGKSEATDKTNIDPSKPQEKQEQIGGTKPLPDSNYSILAKPPSSNFNASSIFAKPPPSNSKACTLFTGTPSSNSNTPSIFAPPQNSNTNPTFAKKAP